MVERQTRRMDGVAVVMDVVEVSVLMGVMLRSRSDTAALPRRNPLLVS